jgi:hypothetical protein
MTESAGTALLIPEPAPEQAITVEGTFFDPEVGPTPCIVVRMPWWRAQSLSDLLTRWTRVGEILQATVSSEEALAYELRGAADVGRARGGGAGMALPDLPPGEAQVVTAEGEFWDGHDQIKVPCVVLRMSWHRAEALAQVFDRWTQMAAIIDESDGSDESVLTTELQAAVEEARSLRHARPARAVFNDSHKVGQADAEGGGEGAEPVE